MILLATYSFKAEKLLYRGTMNGTFKGELGFIVYGYFVVIFCCSAIQLERHGHSTNGTDNRLCLLLCGDVHTNPGPVQYPCGICCKSVRANQKGLLCDSCDKWFHIHCVCVSDEAYAGFCAMTEFHWQCSICLYSKIYQTVICLKTAVIYLLWIVHLQKINCFYLWISLVFQLLVLESSIIMFVVYCSCPSFRRLLSGLVTVRILLLFFVVVKHAYGLVLMIYFQMFLGSIYFVLLCYSVLIKPKVHYLAPVCLFQTL